jgi:hypothetical protein
VVELRRLVLGVVREEDLHEQHPVVLGRTALLVGNDRAGLRDFGELLRRGWLRLGWRSLGGL